MMANGRNGVKAMAFAMVILVFLPAVPLFLQSAQAGPSRAPIEKGQWTVTGTEVYKDQTFVVTGDLTIGKGATLKLTNSSLKMNLSSDQQFQIKVQDGGKLVLNGTGVRSMNPGKRYLLQVTNATLEGHKASISNFTTLALNRATVVLDASSMVDNGATAVLAVASHLDLTGTDIVVNPGTDAIDIEDCNVTLVSPMMKAARSSGNFGINTSGATELNIKDGRIYNFSTGVLFGGRSLEADNLAIQGSEGNGFKQLSGTSRITSSKFSENQAGIFCLGGYLDLAMSDVSARGTGIYLGSCNAIIDHTTVQDSHIGIEANGANATLTYNRLVGNSIGLDWANSKNGTIERDTFTSNGLGALFKESTISLRNCSLVNKVTDLQVNMSKVNSINSTFGKVGLDPTATLVVEWYLDISVIDSSSRPVPGATVLLTDQLGTHYNVTSGPDGKVHQMQLRQRIETRYGKNYNSPYDIEARNGTATGQASVQLVSSGEVTITLNVQDLYFKEYTLSNLTTEVGTPLTITLVVGSAAGPVSGVELQVLEDGQAYASKSFDIESSQATIILNYNPARGGLHNLTFVLDPNDRIEEIDKKNNKLVVPIEVNGSGGGGGGGGGGSPLPDLKPFGVSTNTLTSPIRIIVEVQNAGNDNATNVGVSLQIDNVEIDRRTIAYLGSNSIGRVSFDWNGNSGKHNVKVIVDPDDRINESDETNNVLETQIDISGGLNPNNSLTNAIALVCIGILVLIVIIIAIVLFFMARSTKSTSPAQYRAQYSQAYQYPAYGYGTQYYPTSYPYYSSAPPAQPAQQDQATRGQGAAGVLCPRCRSPKVRSFEDGHRQCQDCKKIFF